MTKQQVINNYMSFYLGNVNKKSQKMFIDKIDIWEDERKEVRFFIPYNQRLYFEERHFVTISLMLFLNYEETERYVKKYINDNFELSFNDESINLF